MNTIVTMISEDDTGEIGIDTFGQFVVWINDEESDDRRGYGLVDPREMKCPICDKGWDLTAKGVMDQYMCGRTRASSALVHKSCYVKWKQFDERQLVIQAIDQSNFEMVGIHNIPSQYSSGWNTAWYEIEVDNPNILSIVMGRRKRVYSIEISTRKGINLEIVDDAFKNEDVTKSFNDNTILLHAWSDEKLFEYLTWLSVIL